MHCIITSKSNAPTHVSASTVLTVQITTMDAQQHNTGYSQPTLANPYTKTRLP
jgi:hypothetical protein